jgi:pimeloyl-ACP methyl ester carboxylesterase
MRTLPLGTPGGDAPVLACLPGLLCPPEVFADAVARTGHAAVGLAWLEGEGPFGLEAIAARVLDALRGRGPTVLVGHSMGVPIAVLAALADRARAAPQVRGLVLANSGPDTRGHGDIDTFVERIRTQWGPATWDAFVVRCLGGPVPEALRERMRAYPPGIAPQSAIDAIRSQQRLDLGPLLPGLAGLPVAVVGGLRDPARPPAHARALAAAPGASLHLLDTGHTSCAERPEAFAAILREVAARASRG